MIQVYTLRYEPFMFGGSLWNPAKTEILDYKRLAFGDIEMLVFFNPVRDMWHIAEKTSGAIVGTDKDKSTLITKVLGDLDSADPDVVAKQIEGGKADRKRAEMLVRDTFFALFK